MATVLQKLYEEKKIPSDDRISSEKNIVLIVPNKDHDIKPVLDGLGLSRYEVSVTWQKGIVTLQEEVSAIQPLLVLQVDCHFTDEWYSISSQDPSSFQLTSDLITDAFVNFHHHDEFSLKDGLGTVNDLSKLLQAQRRSFLCVTNHGSVGGWIKQYNACKKAGVKAIFGMEAYISNYRGDDPETKKAHRSANHLVLIARTREGFDNIIRIHNDAQLNGFYYSPRANREALQKWGKGIVATSACMGGEIPQALMAGEKDKARETYEFYKSCFDRFYIEIQIIEYEDQREANRRLVEFAGEVGAPLILACDSHYLFAEHADTHDLLMCIRQHKTILDRIDEDSEEGEKNDVWSFDARNLYYRNAEQMYEVFNGGFTAKNGSQHKPFKDEVFTDEVFWGAMDNTRLLALETEDIKLDSKVHLPELYADSKTTLREKMLQGFKARGLDSKPNHAEYSERAEYEYKIITDMGFADYFLVVEKIVSDTRDKHGEWSVGFGRGSSGGSLVSYCLGITDIDPIEFGLLFERFIDESRKNDYPDIDLDFDPRVREWVKEHIVELFGKDNVCSIGTYSTYKTRAVILDVARALGKSVEEANAVTKRIDPLKSFEDDDGEDTKVDKMSFEELCEHYPELKEYFANNEDVLFHAKILRNQIKNMGTHAGGVIISDTSFQDRIPVLHDKSKKVISAWAESGSTSELSAVGIVKYDILGLKNLPIISDCVRLIEKNRGLKLSRSQIPISDQEAIFFGGKKDLVGIFQLQNPSTKPVVEAVGMESLKDVAVVTSLIRPGPMDAEINGVKAPYEYARRKKGGEYDSPECLKDVLAEVYGIFVYQETIMKVSRVLSGFSAVEANKLRKAAGKKQTDLMKSLHERFIEGARPRIESGETTVEEVEDIWSRIETFGNYGFCAAHATAYGAISCIEMWLKYHFPVEYICALLNNTKLGKKSSGSADELVAFINYARRNGIEVLGPDINKSSTEFTIEDGKIRFSLSHIKNVAKDAKTIVQFQPFADIADFHERVKSSPKDEEEEVDTEDASPVTDEADESPLPDEEMKKILLEEMAKMGKKVAGRRPNKKKIESLVAAGAFDCFGKRNDVVQAYYGLRKKPVKKPRKAKVVAEGEEVKPKKAAEEAPQYTDSQWIELEKEMIGLCLSQPPLYKVYEPTIRKEKWKLVSELPATTNKKVYVFGQIVSIRSHTSQKGNQMYIVNLTDGLDDMKFFVFQGGQQFFRDNYRAGSIGAIPLSKFDEGDTRFFDDNRECIVLQK